MRNAQELLGRPVHQQHQAETRGPDHRLQAVRRTPRPRQEPHGGKRSLDRRHRPPAQLLLHAAAHPACARAAARLRLGRHLPQRRHQRCQGQLHEPLHSPRHLRRRQQELSSDELEFPGSEVFYSRFDSMTSSKLHAEFNLWVALEPKCANQAFNVVNGDVESWANLWPKVAAYFGLKVPSRQFERSTPDASELELAGVPLFEDLAAPTAMEGKVRAGKVVQRIDLVRWSHKPEVKEAWARMAKREKLEEDALEKATWVFLGFVLGRDYDLVINMNEARAFGFTGYKCTWDALLETFAALGKEGVLPKSK